MRNSYFSVSFYTERGSVFSFEFFPSFFAALQFFNTPSWRFRSRGYSAVTSPQVPRTKFFPPFFLLVDLRISTVYDVRFPCDITSHVFPSRAPQIPSPENAAEGLCFIQMRPRLCTWNGGICVRARLQP